MSSSLRCASGERASNVMGLGKICVIVNPNAANGSTGRRWPKIQEALQDEVGPFDSSLTEAPGDATRLARRALDLDYDTILSLGGDGTHNEVVNGFFENGRVPSKGGSRKT